MKSFLVFITMLLILVGAGFFRITQINDQSLWLDEGITYYNSSADNLAGVWDKTARLDQSPPGYYFINYIYLKIFGEKEFGFRIIPISFGILSVLFLYLLASAMFGRVVGLMSAALLAINSFHIGFSLEARMYVLLSLEAIVSFYALYKAMQHHRFGTGYWLLFTLSSIAGLYTHNFYMFVLLAFALIFWILFIGSENKYKKVFIGLISASLIIASLFPWLPSLKQQLSVDRYWFGQNSLQDIPEYFLHFSKYDSNLLIISFILAAIAVIFSFLPYRRDGYKKNLLATLSLVTFIIVGFGAPLAYSIYKEPILKIRYLVYIVPILMILISVGICKTAKLNRLIPVPLILAIIFLNTPWQASAYPREFGEDFRGLMQIVGENTAPLVVHTPSAVHTLKFYNHDKISIHPFPFTDDLSEFTVDESLKHKFQNLITSLDSFYLVITHSHEELPPQPETEFKKIPGILTPLNPESRQEQENPGLLKPWSESLCTLDQEFQVEGFKLLYFRDCK